MALPAKADDEELAKENAKSAKALKGSAVFSVAKVRGAGRADGCETTAFRTFKFERLGV